MKLRLFAAVALICYSGSLWAEPVISEAVAPSAECLRYDGDSTKLSGTMFSRIYFGPPGYGEAPLTDAREQAALLLLDAPICVNASAHPERDNSSFEENLIVVQLAPVHVTPSEINEMQGRRVTVTGRLYHALTGHHRTSVLLDVHHVQAP